MMTTSNPALARVPMNFKHNQVRIPLSVNGSEPFELVLDTGMPNRGLILGSGPRVDALNLSFPGADTIQGGGNDSPGIEARIAPSERLQVGELEIDGVPVIVLPAEALTMLGTDGIIGAELFERFAVRVDVDAREVVLMDPSCFEPAPGSSVIPLRIHDNVPFMEARMTVDSREPANAELGIDLGAGHALWLNHGESGQFAPPAASIETVLGMGVTGVIRGVFARVQRVEFGGFAFNDVVSLFPVDEHQRPGGFDTRDGFIGAELLSRFAVTFDYNNQRMVLERGALFDEPFEYDMTGIVMDLSDPKRLRVNDVLAGSPAAEAGVLPGDIVTALDGTPVSGMSDDALWKAFVREGTMLHVTLTREGSAIEKPIRLRRLL